MTVGQTGMTWILSSRNDVLATSFPKRRKSHQPFGGIVNEANAR